MNTKQLKAKVLDLAIHGKLLSPETVAELKKSPDYETADVLLKQFITNLQMFIYNYR